MAIRRQAEGNLLAVKNKDYPTILKNTFPPLKEKMGGEEKMIELMKTAGEEMLRNRQELTSMKVGEPSPPESFGDKMISIVPMELVMTAPNVRVTQESYLLAVSLDRSKTWSFLDGGDLQPGVLELLIPDFPKNFHLPEIEMPRVECFPWFLPKLGAFPKALSSFKNEAAAAGPRITTVQPFYFQFLCPVKIPRTSNA